MKTETDEPQELWVVRSWREIDGQRYRHSNWFESEAAAKKYATWINDGRGEVISVSMYVHADASAGRIDTVSPSE